MTNLSALLFEQRPGGPGRFRDRRPVNRARGRPRRPAARSQRSRALRRVGAVGADACYPVRSSGRSRTLLRAELVAWRGPVGGCEVRCRVAGPAQSFSSGCGAVQLNRCHHLLEATDAELAVTPEDARTVDVSDCSLVGPFRRF